MSAWSLVLDLVILLATALLLGILFERLKQNAIVGYLLTGILLGPAGLRLVESDEGVRALAELGVALLLFTIGLEFSWSRLRQFGALAAGGGALQIVLTIVLVTVLAMWLRLAFREAVVVGAAVSLSSTAVVLRVLADRAELDSLHGRNSLGILLFQDIAIVPLVLLTSALSKGVGGWSFARDLGLSVAKGCLLVAAMVILSKSVLPRLLGAAASRRNRELPILLAITIFLAGTWASHALGLSPVLGAFLAGMLLAESPFAEQVRADVTPLRTGFVTVFFASIGMLVELPNGGGLFRTVIVAAAIVAGKALVVGVVIGVFRQPRAVAVATGLALAQIGEFSFVLAELGSTSGLLTAGVFQILLSASLLTLLATPYVIAAAPKLTRLFSPTATALPSLSENPLRPSAEVIVVGLGPAGHAVVSALGAAGIPFVVLELNPRTVEEYRSSFPIAIGDATQPEILHHIGLQSAKALVITIPDPYTARLIIRQARLLNPELPIVARGRYHVRAGSLWEAGANSIVDEEELVGGQLGADLVSLLRK